MYQLVPPRLTKPTGIRLVNMNDAFNGRLEEAKRDQREYTTRVVRTYREVRPGRFTYERLDFEPERPTKILWNKAKLKELVSDLRGVLSGQKVQAVLVKDLLKGVIVPEVIKCLLSLKELKEAHWYVSTKRFQPPWLAQLRKCQLRLFLIPQVAAQEGIRKKHLSCWITPSGEPSEDAIRFIDRLQSQTGADYIVVLPEGVSALARGLKDQCVVQSRTQAEGIIVPMGGASIFFPAMVACMEHMRSPWALKELVSVALSTTYDWVRSEARRIVYPRTWQADPTKWEDNKSFGILRKCVHQDSEEARSLTFGDPEPFSWHAEQTAWKEAFESLGIVKGKRRELQLWRAMVEVNGYVCCDAVTRRRLRDFVVGIHEFAKAPRYHASCMLLAPPGSGKTFLAKCLAAAAELRLVPFNITQMRSKGDVLDCFDKILATQDEAPGEGLLIFVDEINAELDNAPVYGMFLTALEDGTYVRNGQMFHMKPCAWVFAGTEDPKVTGGKPDVKSAAREKGSDFVSRLTLGLVSLVRESSGATRRRATADEAKKRARRAELFELENVYLGVALLRAEYPDVRRVSERVLASFLKLPPGTRVREIRHFVRRFGDIQYGRVASNSLPEDAWPGGETTERAWWRVVKGQKLSDNADIEIV